MEHPGALTTQLSPRWVPASAWTAAPRGELLGEGAGGQVWATALGVVKRARPGAEEALAREAEALFWAGGYGAPALYGVGLIDGSPALLLERLEGEPVLEASVPAEQVARDVLVSVSTTLQELGRLGFSHGDIKPEHLRRLSDGRVALLDFGLGAGVDGQLRGGTPAYLDPSALGDGAQLAQARDAFALALSVAEVLDPALRGDGDPAR